VNSHLLATLCHDAPLPLNYGRAVGEGMKYRLGLMRVCAGVCVAWLLFCSANYYCGWNYLGTFAKQALGLSVFAIGLLAHRYGPEVTRQLRAYQRLKRIRSKTIGL
jgi:hypothetical protein